MSELYKFKNSAKGLSLVELLVALALASIVTIAVIQLFIQNKESYVAHESVTRLQENGRYAIQLLKRDLRASDYWGCSPSFIAEAGNDPSTNTVEATTSVLNPAPGIVSSIQGTDGAATVGGDGYTQRPDTFSFSGLQSARAFPLNVSLESPGDDPISIRLDSATATNIQPNEILTISNCNQSITFQVTNDVDSTITGTAPNITATIQHGTTPLASGPSTIYNNTTDELQAIYNWDREQTSIYRNTRINATYSIALDDHDSDGGAVTPAIPTLMRNIGNGAIPIVPGVENMQIVYGEDTDADNQADRYINATSVTNWEAVVSARISILVRSPNARNETAQAYTMEGVTVNPANIQADTNGLFHSRRVYTTTVAIRNRTS